MKLSADQQAMLAGRQGWAVQWAMEMLHAVGKACNADSLIPVSSTHLVLDPFAMGESGTDIVVRLAESGARFAVSSTINAISYDRCGKSSPDLNEYDRYQRTMLDACVAMGALASCSCNPFIQGIWPTFKESLAWSESATAPFVNSVIGARSNREGATAFASALTGLTPRYGMHLDSERQGQCLFEVDTKIEGLDSYNLMGALVARRSAGRIPVLVGIGRPELHEMVGFGASAAIVSNLSMYHMVGVTPEAATLKDVFPKKIPVAERITQSDIEAERERLSGQKAAAVTLVSIGSPHASMAELQEIVSRLNGRRVHESVSFLVTSNHSVTGLAGAAGIIDKLTAAGVTVTADKMCFGCDLGARKYTRDTTIVTNSVKLAVLAPGSRGVNVLVRDTAVCVEAAVSGQCQT
jgi:predicted aconitase